MPLKQINAFENIDSEDLAETLNLILCTIALKTFTVYK